MAQSTVSAALIESLTFLLNERFSQSPQQAYRYLAHANQSGTFQQLQFLQQLLCARPAIPSLPTPVLSAIDKVLIHQRSNRILTSAPSIPTRFSIPQNTTSKEFIRLKLWKGDITTLSDITAVVNAANSELVGCFQPSHKCIDNVLHSAAGPGLRAECNRLMSAQKHLEPVGRAKVTPGFQLPAKYVVHTVGPSLHGGKMPTEAEKNALASCYRACLEALDSLERDDQGRLSIAFCCISTGLFAFPAQVAAGIAVATVIAWCGEHPHTSITDVIFNVFTDDDLEYYAAIFDHLDPDPDSSSAFGAVQLAAPRSVSIAEDWVRSADYLIISAGAGLSAAAGLDYTSTSLFKKYYPAFTKHGLSRLYDTIGFNDWPSPLVKWGYFFSHAKTIAEWPASPIYTSLLNLSKRFGDNYFVRTSNADGFFVKNGFPASRVSTPQGQYRFLQCYEKCRPDAVFEFAGFLEKALPFVDPETQCLTDDALIPRCEFCGTELTLCVRGGSYFNEEPFEAQEDAWDDFIEEIQNADAGKTAVVLELGVGMNTPGVLRWPNESLVGGGDGRFKLVRAGLGPSACVSLDLEEEGLAVVVDGDIGAVVRMLTDE